MIKTATLRPVQCICSSLFLLGVCCSIEPLVMADDLGRYEAVDLLTVCGSEFNEGVPRTINNSGVIGGYVVDPITGYLKPCIWADGSIRILGFAKPGPAEKVSLQVSRINEQGSAVGSIIAYGGVYWATFQSSGRLLPGLDRDPASTAHAINEDGVIAGTASIGRKRRGVLLKDLRVIGELEPLPGYDESTAFDVNNDGAAVGDSYGLYTPPYKGTLWTPDGGRYLLPPLDGDERSSAWCINDFGFIAGTSGIPQFDSRIVIWDRALVPHLQDSPPTFAYASGMNNHNVVVGRAHDIGAMLWRDGKGYILSEYVLHLGTNFELSNGWEINDAGIIAATAIHNQSGDARPIVLMPIDLRLDDPIKGNVGEINEIEVTGCSPGAQVSFAYSFDPGLTTLRDTKKCGGKGLSLNDPRIIGNAIADADGRAVFRHYVAPTLRGKTVYVQVVERDTCKLSNRVEAVFE